MATNWQELWEELNDRQRTYLQFVYQLDQEAEDYYRHKWNVSSKGYPPPASEWRWLLYGPTPDYPPPLYQKLHSAGLVDPGTGSTFEALSSRGYLQRRYEEGEQDQEEILYVQMTKRGRRLIRENDPGYTPRPKREKGLLTQSQWRCLRILYENRDSRGVETESLPWSSLRRLRDYKPEPLMRETQYWRQVELKAPSGQVWTESRPEYHSEITEAGIRHYEASKARYQEIYGE